MYLILNTPQSSYGTFGIMSLQRVRRTIAVASITITRALHSVLISASLAPTPWSIDPERTQELTAMASPGVTVWSESFSSQVIKTSSSPTPWTIDPERTQEL